MKVEQASCSQDAHAQWRRKAAHPSPQSSKKNAGRDTSGSRRGLLQLREGKGHKVESPKPSLSRSPTPSLLPTPEGTFQAPLLSPLVSVAVIAHCPPHHPPARPPRTPLPPPGVPPLSLVLFLTAFAPLLRRCGCSLSLGCLNTSSSYLCPAPWTTARVSLSASQCKVPRSELWLSLPCLKGPPLVPPFTQLLKPQTWYSSSIFPFSLILCTACISQAQ